MPSKYLHKRIWHNTRWMSAGVWLKLHPGVVTVAIAGSVGKTTTKDMTAAILSEHYPTVKSRENFDPIFNLPQTALRIRNHRYFVAEMGIDAPGQMEKYLELVQPSIAIMTEISLEHADSEHLISMETATKEEWKLIQALPSNGLAILNGDNDTIREKSQTLNCRKILYGFGDHNDVRIINVEQSIDSATPQLSFELSGLIDGQHRVPILGLHNALCATAAIIASHNAGSLDLEQIQTGLNSFTAPPHRLQIKPTQWGIAIDDTYNSSPKAACAAIDTLMSIDPQGVLVLGDMLELGEYALSSHREVGEYAAKNGVSRVLVIGKHKEDIRDGFAQFAPKTSSIELISRNKELLGRLERLAPKTVLVKASRGMNLTDVVDQISIGSDRKEL